MTETAPTPPWRTPRKPAPRQPLSQDLIVRTAVRVLDAEGLDALSMRRLSQELNTGPASLYAHVANKSELLDLIFDELLAEVEIPDPGPDRWAAKVAQMQRSLRRVFRAHRDLARIALTRIPLGPNGVVRLERTMAVLRASGLPDEIAAYAGDLLTSFVMVDTLDSPPRTEAVAAAEGGGNQGGDQSGGQPSPQEFARQIHEYFSSLPADRFPNLVAMAGPITSLDSERRFELGLEIILRGLETYLPAEH